VAPFHAAEHPTPGFFAKLESNSGPCARVEIHTATEGSPSVTAGLVGFSCILYRAVITILVRHGKGRVTPGAHLGLAQRDAEVRKGKDLQI